MAAKIKKGDRVVVLAGDGRQILEGRVGLLGVGDSFTDAHVQNDLVQTRHLHRVGVTELLGHHALDAVVELGLEPGSVFGIGH